jgi:penicillin V acylase-like amidase (Ntn superfamily)
MKVAVCFRFLLLVTFLAGLPPAWACTSVCLKEPGRLVFGNNLDWFIDDGLLVINKRNVKKRGAWFTHRPEWTSKYGSITTNMAGSGFPTRGMNEAGLVIGEMWLGSTRYPPRDGRPALSVDQWIQYQLDTCATVDEVLATDRVIRIDQDEYTSHFFICDASGKCATVEWLDGKLRACSGDDVKIRAMVNTPYAQCLAQGDDPSGRFGKAARLLAEENIKDPVAHVFSILKATRQPSTRWSLVFDIPKRTLHFFTERNPNVRSISLAAFDLTCSTPAQIVDINGAGSGDIKARFQPCSTEENARVARVMLQKWAARTGPIKEEDMQTTLNYHLTMECAEPPQREKSADRR